MDAHITNWAKPEPYLRRGHIATLIAVTVLRVQLALAEHRKRRDIRRLTVALEDLPESIKRDIGLM